MRPSGCCKCSNSTSSLVSLACCSARKVNRYGSVPLVAAIFLPLRSATLLSVESLRTTSAVHSARLYTYTDLIGLPLARASTAERLAEDAKSTPPLFRYSSERLLPWLNTQPTLVSGKALSSQPKCLSTRLTGE